MNNGYRNKMMPHSVLLISSVEAFASPIADFLNQRGYLASYITAEAAQQSVNQQIYNAVIIDEEIGKSHTGYDFLQKLKSDSPQTRTILLGSGEWIDTPGELHYIPDRIVPKPFDPEMLIVSIEAVMRSGVSRGLSNNREEVRKSLQLSNIINSTLDLVTILRLTCQAAKELAKADGSSAVYFTQDYRYAKPIAGFPDDQEDNVKRIRSILIENIPIEKELIQGKKSIAIQDIRHYVEELGSVYDTLNSLKIKAVIFIPIIVNDLVVASFSLDYHTREKFTTNYISLCEELASQASIAISKLADSHDMIANFLDKSTTINPVLSYDFDLQSVLDTTLQKAVELLRAKSGGIYLYNRYRGELVLKSQFGIPHSIISKGIKPGEGMSGRLVQSSEPFMIVDNYDDWAGRIQDFEGLFGTVVAIPLRSYDGIIGALFVADNVDRRFNDEEAWSLSLFADRVANTIEYSWHLEDKKRTSQIFQNVAHVTSHLSLRKTLLAIRESAQELLNCELVEVYGYDSMRKVLYSLQADSGSIDNDVNLSLHFEKLSDATLRNDIISQSNPYIVENIEYDKLFSKSDYAKQLGIKSLIAIPLHTMESPVGIMFINYRDLHTFTTEEIQDIKFFADNAAVAINNSQLHKKVETQASVNQILYDAAQLITKSLKLNDVLQQIAQQAIRLINYGNRIESDDITCFSHIALVENDSLHYVAAYPEYVYKTIQDQGYEYFSLIGNKRHQTIALRSVTQQHVINVPYVNTDRNYLQIRQNVQSQLSVPLIFDGTTIGVLSIEHVLPEAFTDEDVHNVQALASQAAIAINNVSQVQRLKAVYEITNTQTSAESAQSRLEKIVKQACLALNAKWVSVIRIGQNQSVQHVFEWPIKPSKRKREIRPDGVSRKVINSQKPYLFPDVENNRELLDEEIIDKDNVRAAACLPLMKQNQCIGVIWIHYDTPQQFSITHVSDLQFYADSIAIAYDNAKQVDNHWYIHQLTLDLFKTISSYDYQTSRKVAMDKIAKGVQDIMDCDSVVIYSFNVNKGRLEFPPTTRGVKHPELTMRTEVIPVGSIIYEILRRSEPYVVPLISQDVLFKSRQFAQIENIKSCVSIPLVGVGENVGVMFVNFHTVHDFTDSELDNLNLLGRFAAFAMQSTMLLEKMDNLRELSSRLNINTIALEASYELSQVAEKLLNDLAISNKVEFKKGTIHFVEGNERILLAKHGYSDQDIVDDLSRPISDDPLIHSIIFNPISKPVVISNTGSHLLWDKDKYESTKDVKSWIGVPLIARNVGVSPKIIGFMSLDHDHQGFYKPDDKPLIDFLSDFAEQAAYRLKEKLDIINSNLLAKLQEYRTQLINSVSEIGSKLILSDGSFEQEELALNSILKWIRDLLNHPDLIEIRLLNESGNLSSTYSTGKRVKHQFAETSTELGMTGKAVRELRTIYIPDLSDKDSNHEYLPFVDNMLSELAIPLIYEGYALGVLNIEHASSNAFDSETITLAKALSDIITAIIINHKSIRQLKEIQSHIAESESEMVSNSIAMDLLHSINHSVGKIPEWVFLAKEQFEKLDETLKSAPEIKILSGTSRSKIEKYLDYINSNASVALKEFTSLRDPLGDLDDIDVVSVINGLIVDIMPSYPHLNIKIDKSKESARVRIVKRQFRTVIYNLIINSINALETQGIQDKHGEVDILVSIEILSEANEHLKQVKISISDRGIALPKEQLSSLFDYGFSSWPTQKSTGYGLWRAKKIVQEYSGDIFVAPVSMLESGKTLVVQLPSVD